jgi:LuxR family maltose regulon positive regulatory protein
LLRVLAGRVALALGELPLAASLLEQARRELTRYPDAGVLPRLIAREERELEAVRGGKGVLLEPLTEAEQRVLELLPTHLTVEEIGRSLFVSKNTVKGHLKAIYRKLDVGSRSEAVARARALSLYRTQ